MKKIVYVMLFITLVLAILTSCNKEIAISTDTTNVLGKTEISTELTESTFDSEPLLPEQEKFFKSPIDEKKVTKIYENENDDGLNMKVVLHGYSSEKLNKEFYAKNSEYMKVEIYLTNNSDVSWYQYLPNYCRHSIESIEEKHNHEVTYNISDGNGHYLNKSVNGYMCTPMIDIWEIEPGKTYNWIIKLAAGTSASKKVDLPHNEQISEYGIKLYEDDIYHDLACTFTGNIDFCYSNYDNAQKYHNTQNISNTISVEFVYS